MNGRRQELQTGDGTLDVHLFHPEGAGPWPLVVVYMDAFGVRPQLGEMAQRLASHGYFVALPNLYYRTPFAPFDPRAVAEDGPERDRFKGMIATIDRAKVMRDTEALLGHLDGDPRARPGPVAVVGYCMGGGYALSAAGWFRDRVAVAASFHGGHLATDKPDSPHLLAQQARARIYIGAAEIDPTFPPAQQERLTRALDDANVDYQLEVYEGARHGFAVVGHLVYDRDASERHWRALIQLLSEALQ